MNRKLNEKNIIVITVQIKPILAVEVFFALWADFGCHYCILIRCVSSSEAVCRVRAAFNFWLPKV